MKRTVTALLLAASFVLTVAPCVSAQTDSGSIIYHHAPISFADIHGHFAEQSIIRLSDIGMIAETGKEFNPNGSIDRSLFKQWLQNVTGTIVLDQNADQPFVTRALAAEWIAKALPALNTGVNSKLDDPYTDTANVTKDQHDAIWLLYKEGIMVGTGDGHFNPQAMLTRGEAAVLLDRALDGTMEVAQDADFTSLDQIDPTVYNAAVGDNHDAGVFTTVVQNQRYVVVQAGPVPTSGYTVTIDSMKETPAGIFVHASLHAPAPGSMEAQHVEYPAAYAKVKDLEKTIYLSVSDGDLMTAQPNLQ